MQHAQVGIAADWCILGNVYLRSDLPIQWELPHSFVFIFDVQPGAKEQSSVHANPISQNTVSKGDSIPNETTTCIWCTPSRKV